MLLYVAIFVIPLVLMFIFASVKMIPQYERGVVFRMGKVLKPKGPGTVIIIPLVDRLIRVDMRTITHDVPGQDIITKDNVSVRVSAVVYFRVVDAVKASIEIIGFKETYNNILDITKSNKVRFITNKERGISATDTI